MKLDRFLEPDEKIIYSIRRHPFAFVPSILILTAMAIIPPLLLILFRSALDVIINPTYTDWIAVGLGCYYLFFLTVGLVFWIDYYYDLYIVTDAHILDIDQSSLLSRRVAHISLARAQDVTSKIRGFWQNLLDFGPILIQTAGHEEDILLEDVPHANDVAAKIMHLHDELIKREDRHQELGEAEGVHPPGK